MTSLAKFDVLALYEAMDAHRLQAGLSWRQTADRIWGQSRVLNLQRMDHPISPSTLTGIAKRGDCTCQHALFILRWLGRAPESFLSPNPAYAPSATLPTAGPDCRLRWDLKTLYDAVNVRRSAEQLSWSELARYLQCTERQLTGIRTARFATGMKLAMKLVLWLERPAADFIYAARW